MLRLISNLILPGRCAFCHESTGSLLDLCQNCVADLPVSALSCRCCALPILPQTIPPIPDLPPLCAECLQQIPPVRSTRSCYLYGYPVDRLVHQLKFSGELRHARTMGLLMADAVAAESPNVDLILPIPLSRRRHTQRGFNQAEEIARYTAQSLSLPLRSDLLVRTTDSLPQLSLGRSERKTNVRGVFSCLQDLTGVRCVLLDDVMTTGATIFEAARVLRQANATSVDAWVFCRTR